MTLQTGDLKDMLYDILEIDSFKSKMGSDEEIITLSFSVRESNAAKDLRDFIEKGYNFVLDADMTPGEQSDGTFKVFVEMERDKNAPEQIMELADGVKKLSNLDNLKYRYYKNWKSTDLTQESLEETVPLKSDDYGLKVNESNMENYKNFFNKSYVENIEIVENTIYIKKKYADTLAFNFIDFGPTQQTIDAITESFNVNDFAEIIFLSKYIGDYNITKYGNKLTFENQGSTLVVERILS
jgi:DNA-binding Lrp family transcriptional regulator